MTKYTSVYPCANQGIAIHIWLNVCNAGCTYLLNWSRKPGAAFFTISCVHLESTGHWMIVQPSVHVFLIQYNIKAFYSFPFYKIPF